MEDDCVHDRGFGVPGWVSSLKPRESWPDMGRRWLLKQCVEDGCEGGRSADKEIFEGNVNSLNQASRN